MELYEDIDTLLEKTRWKEEGWDKENPFETIKKYEGTFNMMHFSDIGPDKHGGFKIGINPKTDFGTPAGVYGYPISPWMVTHLESDRIPFAGNRGWVYIFSMPTGSLYIPENNPKRAMSENDLSRMIDKLKSKYDKKVNNFEELLNSTIDLQKRNGNDEPIRIFWKFTENLSRMLPGKTTATWNRVLRECGISGVIDDGTGTIYSSEPHQGVALETSSITLLDVVRNPVLWKEQKSKRETRQEKFNKAMNSMESDRNFLSSVPDVDLGPLKDNFYIGHGESISELLPGLSSADKVGPVGNPQQGLQVGIYNPVIKNQNIPNDRLIEFSLKGLDRIWLEEPTFDGCTFSEIKTSYRGIGFRGDTIRLNNCSVDIDNLSKISGDITKNDTNIQDAILSYAKSKFRLGKNDNIDVVANNLRVNTEFGSTTIDRMTQDTVDNHSILIKSSGEIKEVHQKMGEFKGVNMTQGDLEQITKSLKHLGFTQLTKTELKDDDDRFFVKSIQKNIHLNNIHVVNEDFSTEAKGQTNLVYRVNIQDCSFDGCSFKVFRDTNKYLNLSNTIFKDCIFYLEYGVDELSLRNVDKFTREILTQQEVFGKSPSNDIWGGSSDNLEFVNCKVVDADGRELT